jgi:enoyl-CoA hydratase/carnithine racemase
MGFKRAAYYLYTGKTFDAKTALDCGLVHEVLPAEKLIDRAWELAEEIMKQHRVTRRLTSRLIKRPWQRLVMDHFEMQMAYQFYGHKMTGKGWGKVWHLGS